MERKIVNLKMFNKFKFKELVIQTKKYLKQKSFNQIKEEEENISSAIKR